MLLLMPRRRTSKPSSASSPSEAKAPTTRRTAQLPTVPLAPGVQAQVHRTQAEAVMEASRPKRVPYRPKKMSPYRRKMHECAQRVVDDALRTAGGNVSKAARNLGISRETIYEVNARSA